MSQEHRIAVIVPCFNEEPTIAAVVAAFRKSLPTAAIYVFDNASRDCTADAARNAGAIVFYSPQKGKGNVVRHMFREIDADWYVMVDGDATYSAESAPEFLATAQKDRLDMLIGRRLIPEDMQAEAYRPMHQLGNRMVCRLIGASFGGAIMDVFSGYRVFSREFVKTVPLVATGFDTEVEMTLQALSKNYRIDEMPTPYSSRPEGSFSKLNTYRDGARVLVAFFTPVRLNEVSFCLSSSR